MSNIKQIIIEMRADGAGLGLAAASPPALAAMPGVKLDPEFKPVPLVAPVTPGPLGLALDSDDDDGPVPQETSYILRATLDPEVDPEEVAEQLKKQDGGKVLEVFADVAIQPALLCPGDGPLGTDANVEALLGVVEMGRRRMQGAGVTVAIVDTGINMAYLNAQGKTPRFSLAKSWVPRPGLVPGSLPVDHGTMCAFDVCIAAPKCTLIDIALLQSTASGGTIMEGFLSDGVRAYRHLLDIQRGPHRPGDNASLVVNNSWGMFHPTWDYPVGHPGNYSDNPNHPFNRIVAALERAGADILFAAGNCGADCPDGRCQGFVDRPIYGANSHPKVLSIAGVDVTKERVGYSSIGPGRLVRRKPDLCGFTHFAGSGVYAADGGTSAATPVVAGVVAALRSRLPYQKAKPLTTPARVRQLLLKTAEDIGMPGYDFKTGHGIVNGRALARLFPIMAVETIEPAEDEAIAAEKARPEAPAPNLPALLEHHHGSEPSAEPKPTSRENGSSARPRRGHAASNPSV